MKKILSLVLLLFGSASAMLFAKGGMDENHQRQGWPLGRELFAEPQQGQLVSGIEGEVLWVDADLHNGEIPLLKTADAAYLLAPYRNLAAGTKLKVDAYILQPLEGSEIPGFNYQGQKIIPALMVTLASDENGKSLRWRGDKRRRRKSDNDKHRESCGRGKRH